MTRIHAGAVLERAPGPKYRAALGFAELRPIGPPPKPSTLRKWREEVGPDFVFSLLAPPPSLRSAKGGLRFDEEMEEALAWTIEAAEALEANFGVAATGPDVTTGQRDRGRLKEWFDRWPSSETRRLVWQPAGLWDWEIALPFAQKLGVLWAFDPLAGDAFSGSVGYARMRAIGQRSKFSETLLLDVIDTLEGFDEAYVAIDSPKSFAEAKRLAQIAP